MSIKQLGTQSLIYGTGHVVARSVTFLLLPLYTNIFSLEDYGVISLIYTFLGFMNVILHYGLDASLLKHYVPADNEERKRILTNSYVSFLLTTIGFVVLMILLRNYVSEFLFGSNLPQITFLVSGILFFDVLWAIHVLLLRAEGRPILFTAITFLNVLSALGLNLFFVLYLELGIYGVLLSNIITSACIFLATSPLILKRISINTLSMNQWKGLMKFGCPFLFSGIFAMILELSDRYILRYFTNIETVGLYNAGYKLGMLMMLVVMGFNMAWQPFFLNKKKEERDYIAKVTTMVLSVLSFLWILLLIWSEDLVKLQLGGVTLLGEEFWPAMKIIPIIALAYLFHALYLLQLPSIYLLEKSNWVAWIRGVGAGINILLNFLLIPKFGIMGAASATCVSFILMALILYFLNQKLFPIKYEWTKLSIICCSVLLIWIVINQLGDNLFYKLITSGLFPIIVIATKTIHIRKLKILFSSSPNK